MSVETCSILTLVELHLLLIERNSWLWFEWHRYHADQMHSTPKYALCKCHRIIVEQRLESSMSFQYLRIFHTQKLALKFWLILKQYLLPGGPYNNKFGRSAPVNESFKTATTSFCSTTSSTFFGRLKYSFGNLLMNWKWFCSIFSWFWTSSKWNLLFFHPWSANLSIAGRFRAGWCTRFRKTTTNFTRFEEGLHFFKYSILFNRAQPKCYLNRCQQCVWKFWRYLRCAATQFDTSVHLLTASILQSDLEVCRDSNV